MHRVAATRPDRLDHRTAQTTIRVVGPEGRPLAGADAVVAQTGHAFGFGNIGFDFIPLANGEQTTEDIGFGGASAERLGELADLWLDVFNTGTLPFYWRTFEGMRAEPDTGRLLRTAQWLKDRGCAVKGHPLAWHTLVPEWLQGLATDDVSRVLRDRITREVTDFAGVIDTWDAINEVVIMPVYDRDDNAITRLARREGRVGMVRLAFDTARAANPDAVLLLNDFNMSAAYEQLIEDCLGAGVRIDAIGLQSHMHQGYWGEERTLETLDRFARFGLPLHMTENTLLSGALMPAEIEDLNDHQVASWPTTPDGETRQADEIDRHYRTLFGHPAVHSVTYWGLSDDGVWLGAPAGLVRRDGSPKPSYDALRSLVKGEWWLAPTRVRLDDHGTFVLDGFRGDYSVRVGDQTASIALTADTPTMTVSLAT